MIKHLEIIGFLLLCFGVLGLEQVYGPPFVFFFLLLGISFRYEFWERVGVWVVVGLGLAGIFNLPLSWGVGCVFLITGLYVLAQPAFKSPHLRATVISLIGSLIVANIAQVPWGATTLFSLALSLVGTLVLARQFFWSRDLKVI
jgi:hypothetical protein